MGAALGSKVGKAEACCGGGLGRSVGAGVPRANETNVGATVSARGGMLGADVGARVITTLYDGPVVGGPQAVPT